MRPDGNDRNEDCLEHRSKIPKVHVQCLRRAKAVTEACYGKSHVFTCWVNINPTPLTQNSRPLSRGCSVQL